VCIAGLHELPPHAVSLGAVHSTHVPALQTFLPRMTEQSVLVAHGLHVWLVMSHRDAVGSVQSDCSRHATQVFVAVLQKGLAPVHRVSSSSVHSTQLCVDGSQAGVLVEQCAGIKHSTQVSVSSSQAGVAPPHRP